MAEDAGGDAIRALLAEGLSTEAVASQLGVSPRRVAAVKAHITMGTYNSGRARSGGIYLRQNGELIALTETAYATEDVLRPC